jgi:hypothetical protein
MARKRSERQVFKKASGVWAYRYYDADGVRRQVGGFETKGNASDALDGALKEKRGEVVAAPPTLSALVDEYLEQYGGEENTRATLGYWLKHATDAFGPTRIDRLKVAQVAAWRNRLSKSSRHHYHSALKQVLAYALTCDYGLTENVATKVRNPSPKRPEVQSFGSWDEVDAVAAELLPRGTGQSRSSPPAPGSGPRSGSRSPAQTSTARRAYSASIACSRTAE